MAKIAVFSGDLSYFACKAIAEIDRAVPGLSWLVVLDSQRRSVMQLARSQWRNVRRNGWRWIPYEARYVLGRLRPPRAVPVKAGDVGAAYTPSALRGRGNVEILAAGGLHDASTQARVQAFAPDLGLALAAPILEPALFELPRLGTLNLHQGRVPEYRGMPPAFWELWNDERSVGCTVHWVAEKLDAGEVVAATEVPRQPHSTVKGLQLLLDEVAIGLLRGAVHDVLRGTATATPQPAGGRSHRKPTLTQVAALERRLAPRGAAARSARATAKRALAGLLRAGSMAGVHSLLAPRITVLLYHRVTDEVRDNLTVGIAQFARQMALLRERCTVLRLDEVLAAGAIPRSRRPLVAVTFDDGYLDNYTHAVPILERHGIPAAFFVSTGIIGSQRQFPHDVARGNPPIPVMAWDHLRDMRDRGFVIGSHSVSHIDCAAEPEHVVVDELERSRGDLARELGCERPVFAYPYGGRANMTPARLELVRRGGYSGCLAAYGGSNVGTVDRFNVLRRGIHWEFDDAAFLLQCYGVT